LYYLQVFRPLGPLQLTEQQSELLMQMAPAGLQLLWQFGALLQSESAQSVKVSQSLSMPSLQFSVVGMQVEPARKGATEL
jgi:hypothetical protein